MNESPTPIDQYDRSSFAAPTPAGDPIRHDVYSLGSGPAVVVIQELPGIGPQTLRLADQLRAAGFQVVLPHLFGPLGKTSMVGNLARVICMRREFHLFQSNGSSPIVHWLRALCRDLAERTAGKGVGVIGMCLTGNFAISLMADDAVMASVASQPSMPLLKQSELHMSQEEIAEIKDHIDRVGPMLAYRFDGDKLCSRTKFQCLNEAFNEPGAERIRLQTLPGSGHSVLTLDFVDQHGHPTRQALDEIIEYFAQQLK